jgi:hypothetical protein
LLFVVVVIVDVFVVFVVDYDRAGKSLCLRVNSVRSTESIPRAAAGKEGTRGLKAERSRQPVQRKDERRQPERVTTGQGRYGERIVRVLKTKQRKQRNNDVQNY